MGRFLAVLGIVLTVFYLAFIWWLTGDRILSLRTMALNEVGDFLAGAFGPLAILWLVLGFFQQGVELRQGTRALELQADELRASVEQQSAMVEISTKQLGAAVAQTEYERELQERNCEPHTEFYFKHWLTIGGSKYANFGLLNSGPRCTSLTVVLSVSRADQLILGFHQIFDDKELSIEMPESGLSLSDIKEVTLSYTKSTGTTSYEKYNVQIMSPKYGDDFVQVMRS